MSAKKNFFAVYDYGMGGVWLIINARSKDEITQKYPFLSALESRPDWMTDDVYERIASTRSYDIDDQPSDNWGQYIVLFNSQHRNYILSPISRFLL